MPLAAWRPFGHVGADLVLERLFRERADLADVAFPTLWPPEGGYEGSWLSEREVHPAHPGAPSVQEVFEAAEVGKRLRVFDTQGVSLKRTAEDDEGFPAARSAREVEAVDRSEERRVG